jgi:hypothetical protein
MLGFTVPPMLLAPRRRGDRIGHYVLHCMSLSLFRVGDPRSLCWTNPQETDIKPFAVSTAPHWSAKLRE